MFLVVIVEDWQRQLEVPDDIIEEGQDFFNMIDSDIDKGWKMGPEYIENPNQEQRIQIVADRLLTAIETEKDELRDLLVGYIVSRDPGITAVRIDPNGDPLNTEIMRH